MHSRFLPLGALLIALGALAHSLWLQWRMTQLAASPLPPSLPQPSLTENSPASLRVEDLSLRFTQPNLFLSRDELPMYTALYELRRRGLLKRGMAAIDVKAFLGTPDTDQELETAAERPNHIWNYGLHASSLTIEINPEGEVLSFTVTSESDRPHSETW
jgi:hypothetical protein